MTKYTLYKIEVTSLRHALCKRQKMLVEVKKTEEVLYLIFIM